MTVLRIVVVKDRAVDCFGTPFFVKHPAEAVRSFSDEVNREGSTLAAHPDDYDIYMVGEFDDQTGAVRPSVDVDLLARGKDLVKTPN